MVRGSMMMDNPCRPPSSHTLDESTTPAELGFDDAAFKLQTPTSTIAPAKMEDPLNTPSVTVGGGEPQAFFPNTSGNEGFPEGDLLPQITGKSEISDLAVI